MIKQLLAVAVAVSLSSCVIAAPKHHRMDGDDVDQYASGYGVCTQVQEANGDCTGAKHRHAGNKKHRNYNTETGSGYQSADGHTMLTREGKTLPACGELEGASQADNGNRCWW